MSYEGYVQALCKVGHYNTYDCYNRQSKCCICLKSIAWENEVDETNCDSAGKIPLGKFKIIFKEKTETCKCCGHVKVVEHIRYAVPEGKGHPFVEDRYAY